MNKRAILITIGLMFGALLGTVILQVNWIRFQVNLNEEQFNNKVIAAINEVAERLKTTEQLLIDGSQASGFKNVFDQKLRDADVVIEDNMTTLKLDVADHLKMRRRDNSPLDSETETAIQLAGLPLAERIALEDIEEILQETFRDRGIDLEYEYGVFSNQKNQFVIKDGQYLVENDSPQQLSNFGFQALLNSRYSVGLFDEGVSSPGRLMIYFPSRRDAVWGGVWPALLSAGLFTFIILGCFGYVVTVIFQQKRLGEMKNDFINNMTHEFKTPIATISLAADSITSERIIGNPDKVARFADIIRQENVRMNNQVEKVLQMALIDRQNFSLRATDVDLHQIIENAVTNISLQVEKRGGTVSKHLQADTATVQGDLTHLSNIVNNLLDNANKYSPETPVIEVHTRNYRGGFELTIKDHGRGMTPEQRKHIFDKFYRAHTGNLHDVKGFGLGLSYVKAMVDAHNGTIQVKSDLGRGSSFILWFPQSGE